MLLDAPMAFSRSFAVCEIEQDNQDLDRSFFDLFTMVMLLYISVNPYLLGEIESRRHSAANISSWSISAPITILQTKTSGKRSILQAEDEHAVGGTSLAERGKSVKLQLYEPWKYKKKKCRIRLSSKAALYP
jgi:hypothetical protein